MGPLKLEEIHGACTCHLFVQMVLLQLMLGSVNWQVRLVHLLWTELGKVHCLISSVVVLSYYFNMMCFFSLFITCNSIGAVMNQFHELIYAQFIPPFLICLFSLGSIPFPLSVLNRMFFFQCTHIFLLRSQNGIENIVILIFTSVQMLVPSIMLADHPPVFVGRGQGVWHKFVPFYFHFAYVQI